MASEPVPWESAWQEALYGPAGFYRTGAGPAGHFTTASHGPLGDVLAEGLVRLADRYAVRRIVDVGAGRGELLAALARHDRAGRDLLGVDVVPRPDGLDDRVDWLVAAGGAALPDDLDDLDACLVVANEWLDVVPCPVAEADDGGALRTVLVDPVTGRESLGNLLGDPLAEVDAGWADRWWPARGPGRAYRPGERVEIGRPRDAAWADLVARLRSGLAVAVDYGHRAADRPREGTLTAYRAGLRLEPGEALAEAHRGEGPADLTAHVAVDSLAADRLLTQRDALGELGLALRSPDPARARTDPAAYLESLRRLSAATELRRPGGLGDFWWAVVER